MFKRLISLAFLAATCAMPNTAFAQAGPVQANVVSACGTTNNGSYVAGTNRPATQDTNGNVCIEGGGGGGSVLTTPAPRIIVPLDISTVTTGGMAVTALNAGHRTAGGFLLNPIGATVNLCINEQTTASGTTSAAGLTCILPGQSYTLTPAAAAVSVITSDSSHPFSGYGLN